MESLETKVRLRLEELGMKFHVFCSKVGMSDVAMRKVFQRNDCKVEDLKRMASALGVTASFLIDEVPAIADPINKNDCTKEMELMRMKVEYLEQIVGLKDELLKALVIQKRNHATDYEREAV